MSLFERTAYRVGQFRRTISPRVTGHERAGARQTLGPQLYPLFASMQRADQRHCLDVFDKLTESGCQDTEMLQAALIHDAGKGSIAGASFGVRHRVLFVILQRLPQRLLDVLVRYNRGIRGLYEHDRRTIELAREYGAPDGVVRLLKAMAGGRPEEPRAALLLAADDQS